MQAVLATIFTVLFVVLAIVLAYAYCMYRIYERLGMPGWTAWVPLYNIYLLCTYNWSERAGIVYAGCCAATVILPWVMGIVQGVAFTGILMAANVIAAIATGIMWYIAWYHAIRRLGHSVGFFICFLFFFYICIPILAFERG